jgi:predicted ATPase/class 3 adenylate cyclase
MGAKEGGLAAGRQDLPTGTVTFLFSDIEGSTKLLHSLREGYQGILEDHQRLMREAFAVHGGVEVSTEGDSFFVVFPVASSAVAGAVRAQRALGGHSWPEGATIRVRMGLHTGEGRLGGDNYVGVDVNRAARITSAGHGGQVVLSETTRALVQGSPPEGVSFRDLGEHRLKDLPGPERLSQVVAEGLAEDFPPLRSLDARPNNLPSQLTSFVGRERELTQISEALGQSRLVTLTGPGGTGKTRLALEVAAEMLPSVQDGAFFVPLGPIRDPELVVPTISQALDVDEHTDRQPWEALAEHVRDRDLLLVLDNLEQVIAAGPDVGRLLQGTDRLRVLATSREPLGIGGEREYPVPSLPLPDPDRLPALASLTQFPAVALFAERAATVKPDFRLTDEVAVAVAEICARLDGLPLAIELAAARVKLLSPPAILKRLDRSLTFLGRGVRDHPARQQTLRDTIAWSYDLLDEPERRLFARLAVFRGGFTLEAAEGVGDPHGELGLDVLDGVESLLNKSLLRQGEEEIDEPRFRMLETIREFAAERLALEPDVGAVRRRHAAFYLALAERAAPQLTGADQRRWLNVLTLDHDNLRAALEHAVEDADPATAMRLSGSLWRFWQMRGHLWEARDRFEAVLAMPGADAEEHLEARALALEGAGGVAYWMADRELTRRYYEECLQVRERLGDPAGIAEALYNLSFAFGYSDIERSEQEHGRSLQGRARDLFEQVGDELGVAKALWGQGTSAFNLGELEEARRLFDEVIPIYRGRDDRFGLAWGTFMLGITELRSERLEEAIPLLREALSLLADAGDTSGIPLALAALSGAMAGMGEGERSARLAGAADSMERSIGGGLNAVNEQVEGWDDRRRALLPPHEYERLFAEGGAMSVEDAVDYALEE